MPIRQPHGIPRASTRSLPSLVSSHSPANPPEYSLPGFSGSFLTHTRIRLTHTRIRRSCGASAIFLLISTIMWIPFYDLTLQPHGDVQQPALEIRDLALQISNHQDQAGDHLIVAGRSRGAQQTVRPVLD